MPCVCIGFLVTIGLDVMLIARAGDYYFDGFSALDNFWYTLSVNFSIYLGLPSF